MTSSLEPAMETESHAALLAHHGLTSAHQLTAARAHQELPQVAEQGRQHRRPAPELFPPEFNSPANIFCVTLYNEGRNAFEKTVASILTAIRRFHLRPDRNAAFSTLCVVADGRGKADPASLRLLRQCGLVGDRGRRTAGAELHAGCHSWDALAHGFGLPPPLQSDNLQALRVVVCLKDCNSGKLHSHALFFDTVCRALQPMYCYQVDTGTTVEPDAVAKVVDRMERSPDCAALALRILPTPPEPGAAFLSTWQYLDCALQKCILWPFEMMTGHLSVVPGQACVFRWQALSDADGGRAFSGTAGALGRYLRGLHVEGAFERVMYLAEDRVIGNEVVLTQGRHWRLGYAVDAGATTDSCATLGELFRQRRRWRNSAIACRLWLLRQWPSVFDRQRRGGIGKGAFSVAMAAQILLLILDFTAPAQLLALLKLLFVSDAISPRSIATFLHASLLATLALALFQASIPRARLPKSASRLLIWGRWLACLGLSGAILCTVIAVLPVGAWLILLSAPALALAAMRLALPNESFSVLARAQMFPFAELLMVSALSLYALWNFHDVSWGTKGLHHSEAEPNLTRRLLSWRNALLCTWIVANVTLTLVTLGSRGILFRSMSPVLEVTSVANGCTVALSLYYLLRSRCQHDRNAI